jgi:hypothetical protein
MIHRRGHAAACMLVAALPHAAVAAEPAPGFTLTDTYGQPVTLKAYRGAVLWISFGATW